MPPRPARPQRFYRPPRERRISAATKGVTAVYAAQNWSTLVISSTADYFTAGSWKLAAGRTFGEAQERAGKAVCVIGDTVRRKLFHQQNPVGAESASRDSPAR